MTRTPTAPVLAAFAAAVLTLSAPAVCAPRSLAFDVERAVHTLAERPLWPGFEPLSIPLAIFDGERTILFRHPSPPEGFHPAGISTTGEPALVFEGRHSAIVANSSTEIGGVLTGTLLLGESERRDPFALAAVAVHEAFHVYHRVTHPGWTANEADAMIYPVDDPALLAERRAETEALRRALATTDAAESACWTRRAIAERQRRAERLAAPFIAYERGIEGTEGLANYVQHLALSDRVDPLPEAGYPPAAVRQRGYATGTALAHLLDRWQEDWKDAYNRTDAPALDEALAAAPLPGAPECAFTGAERADIASRAADDVAGWRRELARRREDFVARPGWKLVLEVPPGAPLWPEGFDPLNLARLDDASVLHTRFLRLGNEAGSIEMLDAVALTEGPGPHPLFNGVTRLTIAGLEEEPLCTQTADATRIEARAVHGELRGARIERGAGTITIILSGKETPSDDAR